METLQRTANRGSVATGGYEVGNSLKVESDNNEYLSRSTSGATDGNSTQHTISVWVKRTELGVDSEPVSAGGIGRFRFESDDTFSYQFRSGKEIITTRKFRDTGSWYHIVAAADSSQSTASNRMKLYVNGVQETSFGTANYQDQNQAAPGWGKNTLYSLNVGAAADNTRKFNGYIAEMYYIDGQTLDPTYFGEFDEDSNIWKPKAFTGTHGSLDTYLDFSDSSNLGKNSGGTTDLTANNITAADQATDTPTNNFCTWLSDGTQFNVSTDNETFKEGGTKFASRAGTGWTAVYPTQMMAGGKWYMEVKVHTSGELTMYGAMPVARINSLERQNRYHGQDTDGSIGLYGDGGTIYYGTAGSGGLGSSVSAGDIIGLAIDMENYKMYFAVNNTYVESGNPAGNSNGRSIEQEPYVFSIAKYSPNQDTETNFGGYTVFSNTHTNTDENGLGSFVYAPPSGFLALCTKNLATTGG
tara:strand:- start:489 stop:1898 length:1410 start_codon:yes stop_codon:yes gene_type:complete